MLVRSRCIHKLIYETSPADSPLPPNFCSLLRQRSWSIPSRILTGGSAQQWQAIQPGLTKGYRVDHSQEDTMETRFRDIERRMMTALEMVNRKGQLPERLAYEQESMETRQALARSEAHCRALEARVTVLETEVRRHEWRGQAADDLVFPYKPSMRKWHQREPQGQTRAPPVTPAPTTTTVTEAQLQALIDQGVAVAMAEAEASSREMATIAIPLPPEAAHAMSWAALNKMMTDKYCPRGEIKKIKTEMWNLKVKGTDCGGL
ncbi:hypothetical protein Tco_0588608 [Tanacetum coccineum]